MKKLLVLLLCVTFASTSFAADLQEALAAYAGGTYINARVTTLGGTTIVETPEANREAYLADIPDAGSYDVININDLRGSQATGALARAEAQFSAAWSWWAVGQEYTWPQQVVGFEIDNKSQAWTQSGRPISAITGSQFKLLRALQNKIMQSSVHLDAEFTDLQNNIELPEDSIFLRATWGIPYDHFVDLKATYDRDDNEWTVVRTTIINGTGSDFVWKIAGTTIDRHYTLTCVANVDDVLEASVQAGSEPLPPAEDLSWASGQGTTYIRSVTLPNVTGFADVRDDEWRGFVTQTILHAVSK